MSKGKLEMYKSSPGPVRRAKSVAKFYNALFCSYHNACWPRGSFASCISCRARET